MNFPIPLLALLAANRAGDSSSDAGRLALLAMMIRPPMMGLLMASMVAEKSAPPAKRERGDPIVQQLLSALRKEDVRRLEQLEGAVVQVQYAIDNLRELVNSPSRSERSVRATRKKQSARR